MEFCWQNSSLIHFFILCIQKMFASILVSKQNGTSSFITLLTYCAKANALYIVWDYSFERLLTYEVVNECELLVPEWKVYPVCCGSS